MNKTQLTPPPDRLKTLAWGIQHRSRKEFIGLMYLED